MNSSLRKVIKSQQIFPSDEAPFKLVYLAMRNISEKSTQMLLLLHSIADVAAMECSKSFVFDVVIFYETPPTFATFVLW
jgi:transposase-like protein